MKAAFAQVDTTVGDIRGNREKVLAAYRKASALGAEIVLAPELAIAGYPGWDLLEQRDFVAANLSSLKELSREIRQAALVVGFVDVNKSGRGKGLFNAAALIEKGRIAAVRHKSLLPTYDVFDEARYFEPAADNKPVAFRGRRIGLSICEDAWNDRGFWRRPLYSRDPIRRLAKAGAKVIINISASPFHVGKSRLRLKMLGSHCRQHRIPLLFCNLVGGNDDLVFDGSSAALDAKGRAMVQCRAFSEDLQLVDLASPSYQTLRTPADVEEIYEALKLGLRDYLAKSGFRSVLLGLSGGIDSALVCAVAADALGPENVTGVSMPSMYSSEGSVKDAQRLARNLGVTLLSIPITGAYRSMESALQAAFEGTPPGLAEQNLQARLRGNILMALSNKRGAMVLSTGNKSELSVGYCTLYGDMNGGLAVIADVPKTTVYALARYINRDKEVIPPDSISKPPSAELKPDQKDQDDLPPYEVLDDIVRCYIEENMEPAAIAKRRGHPPELVADILARVDRAEYKRRQSPPILKITPKAFGIGRRMPIARGTHRSRP